MLYELRDLRKFKTENATQNADLKQLLDAEQIKATLAEQQQRESALSWLLFQSILSIRFVVEAICDAAATMLAHCNEDLQNASTITYPTR